MHVEYSQVQKLLVLRSLDLEGINISIYECDISVGIQVDIHAKINLKNRLNATNVILD